MQKWIVGLSAVIAVAAIQPAWADAAAPAPVAEEKDGWEVFMPTALWFSGINGDVTIAGQTVDIDVPFSDIFKHTDIGFSTYIEVRKPKFGFYANPNYFKLSADSQTKLGQVNADQQLWIVDAGGFYNIGRWNEERPLTLDVLAGIRYWSIQNRLNVGAPLSVRIQNSEHKIDPVIGARVEKYVTEKLSLSVRGDVGGFDLGTDTMRFTWQVVPTVNYDFTKNFSAFVGYRSLNFESESGSGAGKKGMNLAMSGVMIGFNLDVFAILSGK